MKLLEKICFNLIVGQLENLGKFSFSKCRMYPIRVETKHRVFCHEHYQLLDYAKLNTAKFISCLILTRQRSKWQTLFLSILIKKDGLKILAKQFGAQKRLTTLKFVYNFNFKLGCYQDCEAESFIVDTCCTDDIEHWQEERHPMKFHWNNFKIFSHCRLGSCADRTQSTFVIREFYLFKFKQGAPL